MVIHAFYPAQTSVYLDRYEARNPLLPLHSTVATNYMKDTTKHITIIISKPEFEVINEIANNSDNLFEFTQIDENEYIIAFDNIEIA